MRFAKHGPHVMPSNVGGGPRRLHPRSFECFSCFPNFSHEFDRSLDECWVIKRLSSSVFGVVQVLISPRVMYRFVNRNKRQTENTWLTRQENKTKSGKKSTVSCWRCMEISPLPLYMGKTWLTFIRWRTSSEMRRRSSSCESPRSGKAQSLSSMMISRPSRATNTSRAQRSRPPNWAETASIQPRYLSVIGVISSIADPRFVFQLPEIDLRLQYTRDSWNLKKKNTRRKIPKLMSHH